MKINIKRSVMLLVIILVLMSCSKVFDDITQFRSLSPDVVWTDATYTTQYVTQFYVTKDDYTKSDVAATEEFGLWQQNTWTDFNTDQLSVSGSGIAAAASFSGCYANIRNLNLFFANVDQGTYAGKNYLKGQAWFFLAHQYFRLVKSFGGVPIVKEVINASNPDPQALGRPRNTTLECFNYITQLLDSAIANLPEPTGPGAVIANYEKFRITRPVAMILKSEVLMWKASPVFCTTPSQTYWQDAYNAVSSIKTWLDSKGYGLYTTWRGNTPPYTAMYYDKAGAKKEWIWAREYTYPTSTPPAALYKNNRPVSQGGMSDNDSPTWNLVQRYMMADGKDTLTSAYSYDRTFYWKNRDPRFRQTIAYNGGRYGFPPNPTALANPNRRHWTFGGIIKGEQPFERGYTSTGFSVKKGIDTTLHNQELAKLTTDWPIYRYAEILLNLAECANELDAHRAEVKGLITPIRSRAGIVNLDGSYGLASVANTRDAWLKIIMNERLIEFALEGKRVWDIKRRVLFKDFRNYNYFYGVRSTINQAGVDALKLKVARNGATIVLAKLSSLSLSNEDVYKALSDTLATTANPDQLYMKIMTDKIEIADLAKTVLNPWDTNSLEPIPAGILLTDPQVEQSKDYGGPFNPKLN
jgi:hypothetical protein